MVGIPLAPEGGTLTLRVTDLQGLKIADLQGVAEERGLLVGLSSVEG